jgi:hypothetical protein
VLHCLGLHSFTGVAKVNNGFGETLSKIPFIQFEYGFANVFWHELLIDFYRRLGTTHEIGRVTRRGVEFRSYKVTDETFIGPNYLAVRRELSECIADLRTIVLPDAQSLGGGVA